MDWIQCEAITQLCSASKLSRLMQRPRLSRLRPEAWRGAGVGVNRDFSKNGKSRVRRLEADPGGGSGVRSEVRLRSGLAFERLVRVNLLR